MSMLMTNANKSMKQVVSNIDNSSSPAAKPPVFYNMKYGEDQTLKGDVQIVAKGYRGGRQGVGAGAAQRVLNVIGANPMFTQVVGATASRRSCARRRRTSTWTLTRSSRRSSRSSSRRRCCKRSSAAPPMQGREASPPAPVDNGQMLQNGAPITDHFAHKRLQAHKV
jgi:hypothetical protein